MLVAVGVGSVRKYASTQIFLTYLPAYFSLPTCFLPCFSPKITTRYGVDRVGIFVYLRTEKAKIASKTLPNAIYFGTQIKNFAYRLRTVCVLNFIQSDF
jgi:hypothetical protein